MADKLFILRKLLSRAYAMEFKRFLVDIDYIKTQCPGCIIGDRSQLQHPLCVDYYCTDRPGEHCIDRLMFCLNDLMKKISLTNVHITFLAMASQACINPNHGGFNIEGEENVFDKDNPLDTEYAWIELVSESYEDLIRKNEIEKCMDRINFGIGKCNDIPIILE